MADDGMIVNFEMGDLPIHKPAKDKAKAKPWIRDRKTPGRGAAHGSRPRSASGKPSAAATALQGAIETAVTGGGARYTPSAEAIAQSDAAIAARGPRKRVVDEAEHRFAKKPKVQQHASADVNEGMKRKTPGQIVSRLFSFNKESETTAKLEADQNDDDDDDNDEDAPSKQQRPASNAPLSEAAASFGALGLSDRLVRELDKLALAKPTAIQKKAIPLLLNTSQDAFLQAQTGSGKTLAYLLPILNSVINLSSPSASASASTPRLHRNSGLFAIILTPTRELAKQVYTVLSQLLKATPWLVASAILGGESKKSEKARIRKGVNFLVATPGRLSDHVQNTQVLNVQHVRWLVLDEGDRLMEMGFEEDIKLIVNRLRDANLAMRTRLAHENPADEQQQQQRSHQRQQREETASLSALPNRRVTVLCSATLKMNVQKLGEMSLKDAVHVAASADLADQDEARTAEEATATEDKFVAPAQLKQTYVVTPPKLRLVTLLSLLKQTFARKGSVMKAILFISCADSVEFHYELLKAIQTADDKKGENGGGGEGNDSDLSEADLDSSDSDSDSQSQSPSSSSKPKAKKRKSQAALDKQKLVAAAQKAKIAQTVSPAAYIASVPANPTIVLHKLHGSLPQPVRSATLQHFASCSDPALLITTDVSSRGIDIPAVDLVIELDPAFSVDEHIHRIGRTARAGRPGKALLFLQPGCEEGYAQLLQKSSTTAGESPATTTTANHGGPSPQHYDSILQRGLSLKNWTLPVATHATLDPPSSSSSSSLSYTAKAEALQLHLEQRMLDDAKLLELARRAFQSHIRAYATHVKDERTYFDMGQLHLGHVAKSFALRDAPSGVGRAAGLAARTGKKDSVKGRRVSAKAAKDDDEADDADAAALRSNRQALRKKSMMMMAAADEFNIG